MISPRSIPSNIKHGPVQPAAPAPAPADPEFVSVGLAGIMASTEKLLAINRGLDEPDERDSYAFKHIYGVDKHLGERISLDAGKVRRGLMRNAAKTRSLRGAHPFIFDGYSSGLLLGDPNDANPLSSPTEEINPLHILEAARRITQMGPGGIGTSTAITADAQNIHPSQFGFVSVLESPECHDDETEVFTGSGWTAWRDVTRRTALACRLHGRMEFHHPSRVVHAPYKGRMIEASGRSFNFRVTPNHRLWVAQGNVRPGQDAHRAWRWMTASAAYEGRWRFDTGSAPVIGDVDFKTFQIPHVEITTNGQTNFGPIDLEDWAEFMGWYLSEGCFTSAFRQGYWNYLTRISQSEAINPDCVARLKWLLPRLPFKWSYSSKHRSFALCGKQLACYVRQFGFSEDKFIPEELFHAPIEARRRLLHGLFWGDGRMGKGNTYVSVSRRLAADVDRLATGLGYTTRASVEKDARAHVHSQNYAVGLLKLRERCIGPTNQSKWIESVYDGVVHCATVPGGMLLTRRGYGNTGVWTGNSEKAGVDARLALGTRIGSDGRLYQQFRNRRTQEMEWLTPEDIETKIVAMPK